jgi:hypothetical protein
MTGAELKKMIPDSAVVYVAEYDSEEDPVELLATDVDLLKDGDVVLYADLPQGEDEDEDEEGSLPVGEGED